MSRTVVPFGEIIDSISGGATPLRANEGQYTDSGIKFLRIQNVTATGFDLNDVKYITETVHNNLLSRSQLRENDLLMTITGRIGTCCIVSNDILPANINQHLVRIRLKNDINPYFIAAYLNSNIGSIFSNRGVTGTTRIALDYEAIKAIPIPTVSKSEEDRLINIERRGISEKSRKLQQANELMDGFKAKVARICGINPINNQTYYSAIRFSQLDGVIDAKRYIVQGTSTLSNKIGDVCEVIESKVNVKSYDKQLIDWIRIDDLPNQPLDIKEIRTQPANEVEGTFFEVQEGDILVARLGPTILNQKIVMVRSLERITIASAEFLVLRCKPEYNPEAVMAVLKISYYRDLMYSKARGSTPSRYRLNREDMLRLAFPNITGIQNELSCEANNVRESVNRLRTEAETECQKAKEQFEKELLGGSNI